MDPIPRGTILAGVAAPPQCHSCRTPGGATLRKCDEAACGRYEHRGLQECVEKGAGGPAPEYPKDFKKEYLCVHCKMADDRRMMDMKGAPTRTQLRMPGIEDKLMEARWRRYAEVQLQLAAHERAGGAATLSDAAWAALDEMQDDFADMMLAPPQGTGGKKTPKLVL